MSNAITKSIAATAIAATGMLGLTTPAHAGNACKNVQIEVINKTGGTINIVDIDYWDPAMGKKGGWRSEPIKNEELGKNKTWRETRNLEKINKRKSKLRIEYRVKGKMGGWSFKKHKKFSDGFTCDARDTVSVTIS